PASLVIVEPSDPRLRISLKSPAKLHLAPYSPYALTVQVVWAEDPGTRPSPTIPSGFLIEARVANERAYHLLVPTKIVSESLRPSLPLTTDPTQGDDLPFDRLRLRPIAGRQKFFVSVKNPGPARELRVELNTGRGVGPPPVKLKAAAGST